MPSFLRIPKVQLSLTLLLIYLSVFTRYPFGQSLYLFAVALSSSVVFDLLFTFARRRTFFIPFSAIATGLIIALIIDPNSEWYQIVVTAGIAMGAKNLIRASNRHIFNPAALGLLVGGIIFSSYVAWWGVSFQTLGQVSIENLILFLIVLSPALVSVSRMRRGYNVAAFIITYTVLSHLFTFNLSIESLVSRLFDPSTLFFSLVMLPEPMTSPVKPKRQVLFGISVALLVQLITISQIGNIFFLPDIFILALLLGNLLFFKYR